MKQVIFIVAMCLSLNGLAQEIVKSTSQAWAGGVCCRSGVSYIVQLKFDSPQSKIEVKDVYLKNYGALKGGVYSPSGDNMNFTLNFGTYKDESRIEEIKMPPIEKDEEKKVVPIFTGKALIVLLVDGKEVKVEVEDFEALPHLAYP